MKFKLNKCPFCGQDKVFIGVHDDEGNYHGMLGCDYESDPWSGLSYALHHEGWGDCILCTDDAEQTMGGVLFDSAEEAAEEWNKGTNDEGKPTATDCLTCRHVVGCEPDRMALHSNPCPDYEPEDRHDEG